MGSRWTALALAFGRGALEINTGYLGDEVMRIDFVFRIEATSVNTTRMHDRFLDKTTKFITSYGMFML